MISSAFDSIDLEATLGKMEELASSNGRTQPQKLRTAKGHDLIIEEPFAPLTKRPRISPRASLCGRLVVKPSSVDPLVLTMPKPAGTSPVDPPNAMEVEEETGSLSTDEVSLPEQNPIPLSLVDTTHGIDMAMATAVSSLLMGSRRSLPAQTTPPKSTATTETKTNDPNPVDRGHVSSKRKRYQRRNSIAEPHNCGNKL